MRLFFAINFNDQTLLKLQSLSNELKANSDGGNFSSLANMHLTLHFLGECGPRQIASAKSALEGLEFEPFNITVESIGKFKRDGGDIWWAGIKGSQKLDDTYEALSKLLLKAGFELENRGYSPHITLGREIKTSHQFGSFEPFGEMVGSVELMKSERGRGGLTYTPISTKQAKNA